MLFYVQKFLISINNKCDANCISLANFPLICKSFHMSQTTFFRWTSLLFMYHTAILSLLFKVLPGNCDIPAPCLTPHLNNYNAKTEEKYFLPHHICLDLEIKICVHLWMDDDKTACAGVCGATAKTPYEELLLMEFSFDIKIWLLKTLKY